MSWVIAIVIIVLVVGPLRRPFFRQWRFNLPALVWGIGSFIVMSRLMNERDPSWFPLTVAVFVGLGAGAAVKEWLDDVFGKEK